MSMTEEVTLKNEGNSDAIYSWSFNEAGLFKPEPREGVVPKGSQVTTRVTFTPVGPKADEESLALRVTDGSPTPTILKCSAVLPQDVRCGFDHDTLDFGDVPVGIPVNADRKYIFLKNKGRSPVVFSIESTYDCLTIEPRCKKIGPASDAGIEIKFLSN